MPIYEYKCQKCDEDFEELMSMSSTEVPPCPVCKSKDTKKHLSVFGSGLTSAGGSCGGGNSKFT